MFLSSSEIRELVEAGDIWCSPTISSESYRPFGVRVHMADWGLRPISSVVHIDGSGENPAYERIDFRNGYVMAPGQFLLASTVEEFRLGEKLAGFLDGRSTLARLGLFVHAGSQIIDGTAIDARTVTLELYNAGPNNLVLTPGASIGMMSFFMSSQPSDSNLIHSQYTSQRGATAPRLRLDAYPSELDR